ncbi:hypothetical protein Ddc_07306 [Ditylenchus destructor]|nr:hypothetical protein Ddc_07306 [Ditylenchus destructor]
MIAIWLPTTIFAPIAILRAGGSVNLIFRIHDIMRSAFHLYGLCIFPAQLYSEIRATHDFLSDEFAQWVEVDQECYRLMKSFADSIGQSSVGITVGGMTVITKPMILTCLSMIVPYVVLCLQLHMSAQKPMNA